MMNEENNSEIEIDDDSLALAAGGLSNHVLQQLNTLNTPPSITTNSTIYYR